MLSTILSPAVMVVQDFSMPLAIVGRIHLVDSVECLHEVRLIVKARIKCDGGNREVCVLQCVSGLV